MNLVTLVLAWSVTEQPQGVPDPANHIDSAHPEPVLWGPVALGVTSFSSNAQQRLSWSLKWGCGTFFPRKRSVVDSSGHCQVQIKVITAAPSLSSFSLCKCPCSLLALQCSGYFCWPCQKYVMSLRWGWSPVTGVSCTWPFGERSPEKTFKMAMDSNLNLYGSSSRACTYEHE